MTVGELKKALENMPDYIRIMVEDNEYGAQLANGVDLDCLYKDGDWYGHNKTSFPASDDGETYAVIS